MTRVALAVGLLLGAAMNATAVNPLDDDAGSGGDAGDVRALALPIGEGQFQGRVGAPHDLFDYYSFDGQEGQLLEIRLGGTDVWGKVFTPQGRSYQVFLSEDADPPSPEFVYFDSSGTWYLAISPAGVGLIDYLLHLTIATYPVEHRDVVEAHSDSIHVPLSPMLYAVAAVTNGASATNAYNGQFLFEYDLFVDGEPRRGAISVELGVTSYGNGLSTSPEIPGLEVDLEVSYPVHEGLLTNLRLRAENAEGSIRILGYQSDPGGQVRWTIVSANPFQVEGGPGKDVVTWGTEDLGSDVRVTTPVLGASTGATLRLHLDEDFLGAFSTWLAEGAVTDPQGQRTELGRLEGFHLVRPTPGLWTFEVGPHAGAAGFTAVNFLSGAWFPQDT